MKRRNIVIIIAVVVALIVVGLGAKYYGDRYVGQTYYTIIKTTPTLENEKDMDNKEVTDSNGNPIQIYVYKDVEFVSEDGKTNRKEKVIVRNGKTLDNGAYYKAEISNVLIVNGPNPVAESEVPTVAKDKLK